MFFDLLFIILGLVFGSFFAAFSYRFPRNISISKGRSFCPKCHKRIEWYDNFPVLSFLILGGKCRNCGKKISIRYPIIELSSAVGFWYIWHISGNFINLIFLLIIFSVFLLIFIVDFEHKIIPDKFVFFGILVTFLKLIVVDNQGIFEGIFAGFLASISLLIIHLATKGRGMGLGDVKFAIFGGMFIGLNLFLIWLFLAFLTGAIVGIILILGRKAGFKDEIAFGPFLIVGLIGTYLFGQQLLFLIFH